MYYACISTISLFAITCTNLGAPTAIVITNSPQWDCYPCVARQLRHSLQKNVMSLPAVELPAGGKASFEHTCLSFVGGTLRV